MKKFLLAPLLAFALANASVNVAESYSKSYQYERTGDYKNAIDAMSEVAKAYPDGYTVNVRLGWLHYMQGQFANAIERYQKAIKAVPTTVEGRLGLANVYLAQKRHSDAEGVLAQTLSLDGMNYAANLKLSWVSRMLKKPTVSEKIARRMLALYPADIAWLVEFGWSRWAQGDLATAGATFGDVKILDPENLEAKAYFAPAK